MKKIIVMTTAMLLFNVPLVSAVSPNTVQFVGEVSNQTCSVNINGSENAPMVLLPTVAIGKLSNKGATAGDTTFTVNVTGCTAAQADTDIRTVFVGTNPTESGNLGNAGDATQVSIQLLDSDLKTPLKFTNGQIVKTTTMKLAEGATSTSQDLVARYYAEGKVTPGTVQASAQFAISYR